MKRHVLLVGLVSLAFAGVALADPPSPYVQFHQAVTNEVKHTKKSHIEWIQVDSVGNGLGTTTHVYFSTVQASDPMGGSRCASKGHDGPDYVTVTNQLLTFDHEGSVLVPVKVCGENHSEVVPAVESPCSGKGAEAIPLVLSATPYDSHTHLGLSEAVICIELD